MTGDLERAKAALREELRARLRGLSPEKRAEASTRLLARLWDQPTWRQANVVLCFASRRDEPELASLVTAALASGKTVALPAFQDSTQTYQARQIADPAADLVAGRFGIREPAARCMEVPLNRLDLVLVPGLAFDTRGGRLGRGKGFYDRLLAAVNGLKCGVAFDEQLVEAVPVGPMDVRVNCILTPTRWIET